MIQILVLILIIDYYRLLIYWFLMPFYMEMKANNEGKIAWNSHEAKKYTKGEEVSTGHESLIAENFSLH